MSGIRTRMGLTLVAVAASVATIAGCGRTEQAQAQDTRKRPPPVEELGPVPATIDTVTASRLSTTFRAAADRALPAVVAIRVEQATRTASHPPIPDELRRFMPEGFQMPDRGPAQGAGSGFIFDSRGYIITNRHVVRDAVNVQVNLLDGRQFRAEVVGMDPTTDVAVIRVDPRGEQLPTIGLGDSDALRVGDWVIALGNPMGLNFTVTAGIVSASGRSIGILDQEFERRGMALESFIQTDAAINPGNSGGPLVDLYGRVIGVNSAIQSPTGTYAGYGFAIPINIARRVADDLMRYGSFRRPRLGVSVSPVTEADAEIYKLPRISGAEISSVEAGGPGARAGLELGDVVIGVNGEEIRTSTEFTSRLARFQPGDRVTLEVIRYGKRLRIPATLGEFENEARQRAVRQPRPGREDVLGFAVVPLSPSAARQLQIAEGVMVRDVVPLSGAADAGLSPNLVIVRMNGERIRNIDDFERAASKVDPGEVISLIMRGPGGSEQIVNFRAQR